LYAQLASEGAAAGGLRCSTNPRLEALARETHIETELSTAYR